MTKIPVEMDDLYFWTMLRPMLSGFKDVNFEGANLRLSSAGGAGGNDPSFQIFERAFGISFKGASN